MTPFDWTKEEAAAIKGVYATDAGRFVIDTLIYRLGMLQGASMAPDPHMTAFNEGRRYVAGSLHNAVVTPLDKLVPERTDEPRHRTITATERASGAGGRPSPRTA